MYLFVVVKVQVVKEIQTNNVYALKTLKKSEMLSQENVRKLIILVCVTNIVSFLHLKQLHLIIVILRLHFLKKKKRSWHTVDHLGWRLYNMHFKMPRTCTLSWSSILEETYLHCLGNRKMRSWTRRLQSFILQKWCLLCTAYMNWDMFTGTHVYRTQLNIWELLQVCYHQTDIRMCLITTLLQVVNRLAAMIESTQYWWVNSFTDLMQLDEVDWLDATAGKLHQASKIHNLHRVCWLFRLRWSWYWEMRILDLWLQRCKARQYSDWREWSY